MGADSVLSVPSIPSVAIFVRHSADCKYAGDETYRSCRCPKHFRYSHDGRQVRQSARTRFWKTAEDRRRLLEAKFSADVSAVAIQPESRTTIEKAVALFIADKKSQGVSASVLEKYKRELGRFERFLVDRSKFFPAEISVPDLTEFRSGWLDLYPSSQTRNKVQERLRGFLRYCHNARLIDRVPTLSAIRVDVAPTLPLTEAQYKKLLAVIPQEFTENKAQRTRALVQLMRYSGLAIMDAVTLERSELKKTGNLHRVVTAREKTGTDVSIPLPDAVAAEVIAAAKLNENKQFIFWNTGTGKKQSAVTNWQHDLRQCFRAAGMPNGHPHQLRDTFAVRLLEKGVPLEEVSKLLGHKSIKVTEKHYSAWVQTRQNRLDDLVVRAWD